MATTSPLQALPVPVGTDAPDGAGQMTNLAKGLEPKLVMTFTSAAARTSAFTAAAVSPAAGMLCYRADAAGLNKHEYYNATVGAWRVFGHYADSVTLGAGSASVTFSAIPTYLRTLRVEIRARTTNPSTFGNLTMIVGGDATGSYNTMKYFNQNGTVANTAVQVNAASSADVGYCPGGTANAGRFGLTVLDVIGWDNPTASSLSIKHDGGYVDTSINSFHSRGVTLYTGTAAYTSLTISGTTGFLTGSEFVLHGWE